MKDLRVFPRVRIRRSNASGRSSEEGGMSKVRDHPERDINDQSATQQKQGPQVITL